MVKEEKSTVISAGEEEITGSKIIKGVYEKPAARVQILKKITINLEDNVTKIGFQTHFNYKEATINKDTPHFTLVVKLNNKEVGRATWSDPDVYNKFEEHEGFLQVEVDLEKFYLQGEKRLEFEIYLECWLEEQPWKGGPVKKTVSAYDFGKTIVNLGSYTPPGPEPEISLKIFPTHSPGEDKANYINADWGEPYRLELSLNNKTDFVLKKSSSFELFEDRVKRETATLGKDLDSKQKTIVKTVKKAKTKATWEIQKDNSQENKNTPDYFEWYGDMGSGRFYVSQKNHIYKYYATGYVEASNAGPWDLKTEEISVNVRVPDYKIEAMNVYNKVKTVKDVSDLLDIISAIAGLVESVRTAATINAAEIATRLGRILHILKAALGAILFLEISLGAFLISRDAEGITNTMKTVMDDPPKFDSKYKQLLKVKSCKKHNNKNKFIRNYFSLADNFSSVKNLIYVCIKTKNRYWSAKRVLEKEYARLQLKNLHRHKRVLYNKLVKISLYLGTLVNQTVGENIKRPSKNSMLKLKEAGIPNKKIKILSKLIKNLAKHKQKLTAAMKDLSLAIKQFGETYGK